MIQTDLVLASDAKSLTNINNTWDNVYGAVIIKQAISRVHSVHLMNIDQRQSSVDPQLNPANFICESVGRKYYTSTIAIYYYSLRKLILILPSHGG